MNNDTGKSDPIYYYGHWAWIIGMGIAVGLVALMFYLSESIS